MVDEEFRRIEENLRVIRDYLARSFVGFHVSEDKPMPKSCHNFTLSHSETGKSFRLKVAWGRLTEESNTPDRTTRSLEHGGVANKMRSANGEYFYWGTRL